MSEPEFKVYLAGGIAGLEFDEAVEWRVQAERMLGPRIRAYSPMRGKEFLRHKGVMTGSAYNESELASAHGIMGRDHNDVKTSDAVLMNLVGAQRVSIGSVIEATWCHIYRVPLILVMEETGNIHEHVMFTEIPVYRTPSLSRGCDLVRHLLLP